MLLKRLAATPAAVRLVRWRPDRCALLIAGAGLLGAALVLAREATYGVNLHYDPVNYIAAARNLLAGEGFANFDGGPYVLWPPLYPLLLAVASLGIFDPLHLAGPLNAAIFGVTVIVLGSYLRRRLEFRFVVAWACLSAALAVPLASQSAWAMPGPLFILLATLSLIRTDEFLSNGRGAALIWAAAFSALAWQTRYLGAAVTLTVVLALLLQRGATLPQRARRVAVLLLIATLPMGLWMMRNFLLVGELTGNRPSVDYRISALLAEAGSRLWNWLSFDLFLMRWRDLAFPVQLALVATVLLPFGSAFMRGPRDRKDLSAWRAFHLFGGFALLYLVALIASLKLGGAVHGVQERYVTPAYFPLLVACAFGLDRFLSQQRAPQSIGSIGQPSMTKRLRMRLGRLSPPAILLMLALSLWTLGQVVPNLNQIRRANAEDLWRDFSAHPWVASETLRYVRERSAIGTTYSNLAFLTYLHRVGAGVHLEMPRSRAGGQSTAPMAGAAGAQEQLRAWLTDALDGANLIWFDDAGANMAYDYGAADMRAAHGLALVADLADGIVFEVRKAEVLRARHPSSYAAMTAGPLGAPAARSVFDLHLDGNKLAYRKQPCAAADRAARFFVHLAPAKVADLPAGRRRHGFDNLDFDFPQRGAVVEGTCLAIVQLPDYDIVRIGTGQYARGAGELWRAEIEHP